MSMKTMVISFTEPHETWMPLQTTYMSKTKTWQKALRAKWIAYFSVLQHNLIVRELAQSMKKVYVSPVFTILGYI